VAERFDLLILGSGSTAFAAALKADALGARVAMVERRTLGGTCANRGCLPSKNLIEAARIVHEAAHPRYGGLSPATVAVDFEALVGQKDDVVHDYRELLSGYAPEFGTKNPFDFMELQDVQGLSNFFERTVSSYQVGVVAAADSPFHVGLA